MMHATATKTTANRESTPAEALPATTTDRTALRQVPLWSQRLLPIQTSFKINAPGDKYEQEADRVADTIMRMPEPRMQRKSCACGRPIGSDGLCAECKKNLSIQRMASGDAPQMTAPPIVHQVLQQPGRPLDGATRNFMEARLGHDFGQVRVHTDAKAVRSAEAVNARAYTVGQDVVFGSRAYQPETRSGKALLAHELTHTVQQASTPVQSGFLQRACKAAAIGSRGGCTGLGGQDIMDLGFDSDSLYHFNVECDEFAPGEKARLRLFAAKITDEDVVEIHGFASEEGDATFNDNLSCARAQAAADILNDEGVVARINLYQHGPIPGYRPDRRSVVIEVHSSPPEEESEPEKSDEAPSPEWKMLPKGEFRVDVPATPAWASVSPTYLIIGRGEPYEFPHYLKVRVDDTDRDGGKWNVVALEGRYKGSDADIDPAKLNGTAAYEPAGKIKFDKTKEQLWYGGEGPIDAFTQDSNPVPDGTHDLEIPDFQHSLGSKYGAYATTWFRIGHSGDRYLHPGSVSLGCSTIRDTAKWPDIWSYLIRRRKGDGKSVGTIEVS